MAKQHLAQHRSLRTTNYLTKLFMAEGRPRVRKRWTNEIRAGSTRRGRILGVSCEGEKEWGTFFASAVCYGRSHLPWDHLMRLVRCEAWSRKFSVHLFMLINWKLIGRTDHGSTKFSQEGFHPIALLVTEEPKQFILLRSTKSLCHLLPNSVIVLDWPKPKPGCFRIRSWL